MYFILKNYIINSKSAYIYAKLGNTLNAYKLCHLMLMRKCLLAMLMLKLIILMLILMLLNWNTGYAGADTDLYAELSSKYYFVPGFYFHQLQYHEHYLYYFYHCDWLRYVLEIFVNMFKFVSVFQSSRLSYKWHYINFM